MADIESLLNRWQTAGVLDAEVAARIRAFEEKQEKPSGLRWQGMVALILGAILLACGWRCLSPRTGTNSAPARATRSSSPW